MDKDLTIEVKETEQDIKDLLKKKKIGLIILLAAIIVFVLCTNGKITNLRLKDLALILPIFIIFVILATYIIYNFFINTFKSGMEQRPELYNYKLIFSKDKLTVDRNGKKSFDYQQIKLNESKKSYFIYYPTDNNKKLVSILNKEKCTPIEKEVIDFYLKKQ